MSGTDHVDEDEVLRRMLNTPHESHNPLGTRKRQEREPVEKSEEA